MFSQQLNVNAQMIDLINTESMIHNRIKRNAHRLFEFKFQNNHDATRLVNKLGNYLSARVDEYRFTFFQGMRGVAERNNYIVSLVKLIESNNISEQRKVLEEKNIKRFKGFFSSRLYDILVEYRNSLQKHSPGDRTRYLS